MATIITERDRNLCGVLGEMKWIDGARAERLLPGRAAAEVRSALDRLTKGQRQLFRKERWMSRRGMEPAYCLTDAGHQEACQLLERPPERRAGRELSSPRTPPRAAGDTHRHAQTHLACSEIHLKYM